MTDEKIGERMARVETQLEAIHDKLDRFIDSADKRYAPRWIVTILSWVAGICAVVISAGFVRYLW